MVDGHEMVTDDDLSALKRDVDRQIGASVADTRRLIATIECLNAALTEIEALATAAMPPTGHYGIGLRGPVQKAARQALDREA